jgi:hypothetical protein
MSRRQSSVVILWREDLIESELDGMALFVALVISVFMDGTGWTKVGKETVAAICRVSVRTVDRAVLRLEAAGWLKVKRMGGRRKPNEYTALNPVTPDGVSGDGNPVKRDCKPRHKRLETPSPVTPEVEELGRSPYRASELVAPQRGARPSKGRAALGADNGKVDGDIELPEQPRCPICEKSHRAAAAVSGCIRDHLVFDDPQPKIELPPGRRQLHEATTDSRGSRECARCGGYGSMGVPRVEMVDEGGVCFGCLVRDGEATLKRRRVR